MRNIYVSYRFTGEDPEYLEQILGGVGQSLQMQGHDVFCSLYLQQYFEDQKMSTDEIYDYCIGQQETQDTHLAIIWSPERSHDMDIEADRAESLGQEFILAIKPELAFPQYRERADRIIEYATDQDLLAELRQL